MLDTIQKFTSQKVIFICRKYAELVGRFLQGELMRTDYAKIDMNLLKSICRLIAHTFLHIHEMYTYNMDLLTASKI